MTNGHRSFPNVVSTLSRETHAFPKQKQRPLKIQHSFVYSDGFGREIQTKAQAESENINGTSGPPRWVGSGWTIFNNKGKPVRQYEPFFSATHCFEYHKVEGVSPILFYDPLQRVVGTLHPNRTWEKVRFDAWTHTTWDVNDTIHPEHRLDPHATDPSTHQQFVLTFNPAQDADIGQYFQELPPTEYLPTWYRQRIDASEALKVWRDQDVQGQPLPENPIIRTAEKRAARNAAQHAATPASHN